jgi:hypothetical protein
MTYKEKLAIEHPNEIDPGCLGGCHGCPGSHFNGAPRISYGTCTYNEEHCTACWNSEIPETEPITNEREEKMMENNYSTKNTPNIPTMGITSELRPVSVCDTAHKLYSLLIEIERNVETINGIIFGPTNSDMCAGEPDCLEANICMACNMADIIHAQLLRLKDGLIG